MEGGSGCGTCHNVSEGRVWVETGGGVHGMDLVNVHVF